MREIFSNFNVNNHVQTRVHHPAFWETIKWILTATYQEQSTNIALMASAEFPEREGCISPSSFYGQLPDNWSHVLALST